MNEIKKIAKEFDLEYQEKTFKKIWVSKRQIRYLEYIGMAWEDSYDKYGKTI